MVHISSRFGHWFAIDETTSNSPPIDPLNNFHLIRDHLDSQIRGGVFCKTRHKLTLEQLYIIADTKAGSQVTHTYLHSAKIKAGPLIWVHFNIGLVKKDP